MDGLEVVGGWAREGSGLTRWGRLTAGKEGEGGVDGLYYCLLRCWCVAYA